MIRNFIKKYPLLVFIVVLSFITRLIAANIQSFSNDELSAIYRLQFTKFSDLIHWGIKVDGHPALVQLFLYYYSLLIPKGEFMLRLPFVIASSLSLFFIFFSLKKLTGEFIAIITVIVLAFSGFSIQLGYFARPYAFGILFTSAAMYYWIRIFIDESRQRKYMVAFIIFSILAAYTHYFALLQILVLGMSTFFFISKKLWWKIFLMGGIIFLGFLPHYPITAFQMSVGGIGGWLGKPKDYFIINLLFEYFDRSAMVVTTIIIVLMLLIIRQMSRPRITKVILLTFLSIVPYCILYFYSIKINSVLQFSACFFLMPFMLAAFFSLFQTGEEQSAFARMAQIFILIIFLSSTLFFNNVFAPIHFAEFKRIAQYIEEHESESVATVVAVNNPFYIDYYLKDKKPDLYITDMGDNLAFLKRYIDTCSTSDFIYAFANQRSNVEIPFIITDKFPVLYSSGKFLNGEYVHLSKEIVSERSNFQPKYNFTYNDHKDTFENLTNELQLFKGAFFMNEETEFSPAFEINLKELNINQYDKLIARVGVAQRNFCDMEIVMSVESENKSVFWRSRKFSSQYSNFDTTGKVNIFYLGDTFENDNIDMSNAKLKVYVWNPNRCWGILGPFSIGIYEGNPYTTGYSQ